MSRVTVTYKGVEESRNKLPELLDQARSGQATVITRRGHPMGVLVPLDSYDSLARQEPLLALEAHAQRRVRFAVTTLTIAEVLTGPLQSSDEALARRYRATLESWQVIDLDPNITEGAARLRVSLRLKLADAVQAASALAINAAALVTHARTIVTSRACAPCRSCLCNAAAPDGLID